MKPLVIYHADCTDGWAAAFAAWLALGDDAEYVPMNYGQALPEQLRSPVDVELYILDFSFNREQMETFFQYATRVVWLDHHKTAFEMWCGKYEKGMEHLEQIISEGSPSIIKLNDNKSGALLAWEYFHPGTEVPMLIQHIDDRDRWQWKLEGSAEIHAQLASAKPWSFEQWKSVFFGGAIDHNSVVALLKQEGRAILRAQKQHVEQMAKQARKCRIEVDVNPNLTERYDGLAVNTSIHQSEVGHELANASGTFGLVWYLGNDNVVRCSLRSNGDYDVSAIARTFGGGGHRNAAGFETDIETLTNWLK